MEKEEEEEEAEQIYMEEEDETTFILNAIKSNDDNGLNEILEDEKAPLKCKSLVI